MKISVIIVAGGSGSRMGSDVPKQFLELAGAPVLMRTIEAMSQNVNNHVNNIIVVLPKPQIDYWHELCRKYNFTIEHTVAVGGATRFESVKNGLQRVQNPDIVLIHDGVRPFANKELTQTAIKNAAEFGAAIPVTEVTDSLRQIVNNMSTIVNRTLFRAVQTPQAFRREIILQAYEQPFCDVFTDDASVVESAGYTVTLTKGSPMNIKITTATDLVYANALYKNLA